MCSGFVWRLPASYDLDKCLFGDCWGGNVCWACWLSYTVFNFVQPWKGAEGLQVGVLCDALWFADGHECGVCYGVVQGLTGICLRMFEALFRILSEFVCFLSSLFMFFPSSFSFPITSLLSAACHCCYLHRSFWCLSFFFLIPTAGLLVWSMQRGFQ